VHRLPVTHFGDELHHSGWNACSSCHGMLLLKGVISSLPSLVSGRIHAINTAKDSRHPHTAHCLASGDILISFIGYKDGNAEGNGFLLLDSDLNVKRRWEKN
jgi:selenium-binding protein 1